jgi:hypothetical protein
MSSPEPVAGELRHELSVRVADSAAVLADGIGLRCSCGWEHVEPPPSRLLRRRESDYQLVAAMSARAEQAWQDHQALNRG